METSKKILLVEDDNTLRSTLGMFLESSGWVVTEARSAEEAVRHLGKEGTDLVVTDLKLGGMDGLGLLRFVRKESPETNVVLISAYADIDVAVEALKEGAADFIEKPFTPPVFLDRVAKAFTFKPNLDGKGATRSEKNKDFRFDHLVGRSQTVRKMKEILRIVDDLPDALLISGEPGVGKETLARKIHEAGARAEHPFVAINCSSLSDSDLELELFGSSRGERKGVLLEGKGGTLFLDEISSLSLAMQVKVLKMLENKRVRLSGSAQEADVDVQVICGTNKNLEQMVSEEAFRQDLFYKINVVHLKLDPLRDRVEDIPLLMEYFLEGFNRITGKNIEGFSKTVFDACLKYEWPGNVRELKSFVERIVIFCKDQVVQYQHVPENIREPRPRSATGVSKGLMTLKDLEKTKIVETLNAFKGNKANTAKALGIGRNTLWRKLKEYEIEEEDYSNKQG